MSISGALTNALSGLGAAARAAEVVSSNLSNAMTEGYGRRALSVSSQNYRASGGVMVNGIVRHTNPVAVAERRLADAAFGNADTLNRYSVRVEGLLGTPSDASSLSGRVAALESALVAAAGAPGNALRLQGVAQAASDLVDGFQDASDGLQDMREQADRDIAVSVDRLNTLLARTAELNLRISTAINQGQDTSALEDDRQKVVDDISKIVPVKQAARDRGGVALFTANGAILVDGSAARLEFQETPTILPHMTLDTGYLSGLTVNGLNIRTDSASGPLSGGILGAQFAIRDEMATAAQAELDAVARDLVERFGATATDPTLTPGQAGLFTDRGAAFDPADEVGLSGRLSLNALVAPDGAGEFWRLRDGLGAVSAGEAGNATQLHRLSDALSQSRPPASGGFSGMAAPFSALSDRFLSLQSTSRVRSDETLSFAATRLAGLEAMELTEGVDSDQEMQKLMLIEQSYAANARLIATVDEMMQQLLRL